jgi:heme/copper-type cytochrome/quinol oxidase subunit 2
MILFPIIFTVVLVLGVVVALALRSWERQEEREEAVFDAPATHQVCYEVVDGQDPAILVAALHHAGFEARARLEGGVEVLRVLCDEHERPVVRRVIESVDRTGFEGVPIHVGAVVFRDER